MLMIDPKMVELIGYNGVPHLQCPVVTEMDKVVGALRLVLQEMERRYTLFSKMGVRNLDGYRMKVADEAGAEEIPYLVVIIDELADLMMTAPDDVETVLCRLAQMGRAAGIHLIIATQRPSVDVLTGSDQGECPGPDRVRGHFADRQPGGARHAGRGAAAGSRRHALPAAGRRQAGPHPGRIHRGWRRPVPRRSLALGLSDADTTRRSGWSCRAARRRPSRTDSSDDPLLEQAMTIVRSQGTASASMLQRRLRIGYNRAARLIEQMEADGLIGPADGIKGRPVLDP